MSGLVTQTSFLARDNSNSTSRAGFAPASRRLAIIFFNATMVARSYWHKGQKQVVLVRSGW